MKVLKAIAKKLLLNLYEALYLAFNLRNKWPFCDVFFSQNCQKIRNIIFDRRPEEHHQSILLFLLMSVAAVKL